MRIAHLATTPVLEKTKLTVKEQRHERCVRMVANQKIIDRQKAEIFKRIICREN